MTRGPIPRFDLYEELEVSRLASAEVIEAAYRTLVKRHHPDVGDKASIDADRIKRLNVAHGWLTNSAKRLRYDEATESSSPAVPATTPGSNRRKKVTDPGGPSPMQDPVPMGFGPYSSEVRQFLADLRPIDRRRAQEILAGKAAMPSTAYSEARGAALAASRGGRHDQWLLARDAATVIAKGKLGDWPHAPGVATIVADIAGAFVVRDRIPPGDFELLLSPWMFRVDADVAPARVGVGGPLAVGSAVEAVRGAVSGPGRPVSIGVAAAAFAAVLGLAVVLGGVPKPDVVVAGLTDAPGTESPGFVAAASPAGWPSDRSFPIASGAASPSPTPIPTAPGSFASPAPRTAAPAPDPTPRVTAAPTSTPAPTTPPTPVPTAVPTPTPTPGPTPSPRLTCTVISLIDVNTSIAQEAWNTAGFTGTVLFSPPIPPQYKIGWQSLAVGMDVPCTSDITVQQQAP